MNPKFYQGTKKLSEIVKVLETEVTPILNEMTYDKLEKLGQELEEKEFEMKQLETVAREKIAKIELEYQEKKRAADIQFKLDQQENEKKVFETLAAKYDYAIISNNNLSVIEAKIVEADKQAEVLVAKATNALKAKLTNEHALAQKDAEVAAERALAKITQLENEKVFLQEEISRIREELKEARNLTAKVSENISKSGSNITVTK